MKNQEMYKREVEKIYQEYYEELECIREEPEYEEVLTELAGKELNERLAELNERFARAE